MPVRNQGEAEGPQRTHPRFALEPALANPVRFSLVAALAAVERSSFADLKDDLHISDSALSKQISELEKDGFVRVSKGFVGKRPRTTVSLSPEGLKRWRAHLDVLRTIAGTG
ncbi:transcriptional regulator [Brevibacterium sp. 50QC2O2]|uniref:winged helix-turn-helix domain-containing protein n=1 Tax=Brevibacterium TaxID=1696 RepID=UPI00211BC4AB|nr:MULTISPECIES: transcriptional regulator [unclassified Brevibacterium]MCQ9368191.1 transcriptional regulator [Brevibacterium sp. 91QC2O2]MCQ9385530.1 transcriptional regulator [Brevibacterium sp. 68QC2CO]MCQ9387313.1 transcriptional regulator [Brevibacterium sp. 50QC2O2]